MAYDTALPSLPSLPWSPGVRIGYLSAAPRVSTRPDAEAAGPRAHVLGVIHALEQLGASVHRYVVGDRMPRVVRASSEGALASGRAANLVADLGRVALGSIHARRAWAELGGRVDWVYERACTLQSLGWIFQKHGVPWVIETSGPFFYEARAERKSLVLHRLARRRELWAYQTCDLIVCVTPALRDILVREGVSADKIYVMANGVDAELFDPARVSGGTRPFDGFTVGFAGSLLAWQGVDLLLEALAKVRGRGIPVSLAIAGDGPERATLEQLTDRLALADHVAFIGRLPAPEMPRFLAGIDAGFSGQKLLGIGEMYHSPLKLYEYMAMGKPVIASAFHDAKTLVEDRVTGFLFRPGDADDIARAIEDAYAARALLAQRSAQLRAHILENHTWTARVKSLRAATG